MGGLHEAGRQAPCSCCLRVGARPPPARPNVPATTHVGRALPAGPPAAAPWRRSRPSWPGRRAACRRVRSQWPAPVCGAFQSRRPRRTPAPASAAASATSLASSAPQLPTLLPACAHLLAPHPPSPPARTCTPTRACFNLPPTPHPTHTLTHRRRGLPASGRVPPGGRGAHPLHAALPGQHG